jgi:hypothetical protein
VFNQRHVDPDELRRTLAGLKTLVEVLESSQAESGLRLLNQQLEEAEPILRRVQFRDVFGSLEDTRLATIRARSELLNLDEHLGQITGLLKFSIIPALERQLEDAKKLQPALPELN